MYTTDSNGYQYCITCGNTPAEHDNAQRRDPYICPCCHDTKSKRQVICAGCQRSLNARAAAGY